MTTNKIIIIFLLFLIIVGVISWIYCWKEMSHQTKLKIHESVGNITREEQIEWLCRLRADLNNGVIFTPWYKEFTEALNYVLEQESVLDKIEAEIKQYQSDYDVHGTEYDRTAWKAFNRCLQTINKYKAEVEP